MYLPRLKDLRDDRELFQIEIAELLRISQVQYSRYERGTRDLPIKHLVTLAKFYKVSTDYILGLTNKPNH